MAKGNATTQQTPVVDAEVEFNTFVANLRVGLDGANNLRGVPSEGDSFTFAGTKSGGGGGREYFSFPKPTKANKPEYARMMLAGRKYKANGTRDLVAAVLKAAGIPVVFGHGNGGSSELGDDAV